ncbi:MULTISPECIES: cytochrome c oxidase subunit I [unclassified Roseitalea]|uniref:cytochrome c oxidase subunit I n=1 Tax=unclassified Roseitalea TaxID=2639107 RepID=UPI00273D6B01|nr:MULTISPECIES: cytochrome c oxidase subunit I [unclassified Roseitalea]
MSATAEHQTYTGALKGEPNKSFEEIWAQPRGIRSLTSVSHRVVGKRFIVTGFIFFLIAGLLALGVRTQLIVPGNTFLDLQTYNQFFTMHGTLMMFLFAIPILEGFGVYFLPLMLGARDLIFPRLGAFGYFCYLFGGIIVLSSFLFDAAPESGWFMYTPLTTKEYTPGLSADFWLIGITFAEIASVTAAVELIAAILCARAPGMSLTKMPIFGWYILITAFMIAIGFPPLIIGSVLLESQRLLGLPFFDAAFGGDPLLWQHLFWIFGHPEVYIIFLPAAGFVSTMLPTFVGKPIFGYGFLVAAIVTMGFISFGLWAHHMYATGISPVSLSLFSAASTMVAIPTGIQIFCFIATLAQGRPRFTTPMLFVFGFLFIFVLGGLTGVMLASVPFNFQVHDTYFVVAHLHYVLIGGMVFPLFGAFYYWVPHFTGRMMSETLGKWVFWLMFIGFNTTFFLMHVTGLRGMPRRVATYPEDIGWDRLNMLSSIGSYILAAGIALFVIDFFRHLRSGEPAGRNPWGAGTMEWFYPTVAPGYNFRAIPPVRSREPLWDQPELNEDPAAVGGVLRAYPDHRRETVGCDPLSGEPLHIARLPHPTWVPLFTAFAIAVMFGSLLVSAYWVTAGAFVAMMAGFTAWAWEPSDSGVTRDAGLGYRLPVDKADRRSHTYIAVIGTLLILGALYFSLVFGVLYLWNTFPDFAARIARPDPLMAGGAIAAAVLMAVGAMAAKWLSMRDRFLTAALTGVVTAALGAATAGLLYLAIADIDRNATALGATAWAIVAYVGVLMFIAIWWALFNALRKLTGRTRPGQHVADFNFSPFAKGVALFAATTGALLLAAQGALP